MTFINETFGVHRGIDIEATKIDVINSWANKIAVDDNDMIYLRKKNGIMYVMKAEPHTAGKWEKLDPKAVAVVTDGHGAKLEGISLEPGGLPADGAPIEPAVIPQINLGWYQDEKAGLYKYEGEGKWDAPEKEWGKLLKLADAGILEFIS
jgi:hypothetical protein